jgi:PKD domain
VADATPADPRKETLRTVRQAPPPPLRGGSRRPFGESSQGVSEPWRKSLGKGRSGSASTDPNGDALRYSWDLNGDRTYGDATGVMQTRTFTSPGEFRVGVRVDRPGR